MTGSSGGPPTQGKKGSPASTSGAGSSSSDSSSSSLGTPTSPKDQSPPPNGETVSPGLSTPVTNETLTLANTTTQPHKVYPPPASVGLVNQGCTCYLNSLLQLLFHTSYFRSAVYRMTIDRTGESALIPQALQELFFQMQERKTAPTTKGLTDAFGWDEREVFVQHDIQELAALLRDCLENRMRGTPSEGAINRLFEGKGEQVVETLDGMYTSRCRDTFYDIHLPIHNVRNIEDSMRSLIQKDQLVGDNKYRVEEEGKPVVYKDAQKGYRFIQFPPVILFHLKRFEMDMNSPTLEMKKVNSAFEFGAELDLREFETGRGSAEPDRRPVAATDEFDRDSQAVYDLHGVIVHRGTARSGHYYCYLRHYDAEQGKFTHWLEYDDENVRVVDQHVAIEENFGGMRYSTSAHGRPIALHNLNNAYILSYVRRADRKIVLAPTPTDIIPEHVKRELRRLVEADEKRAKYDAVRRTQIRIALATDDVIDRAVRASVVELLSRDERLAPSLCRCIDVQKADAFASLYRTVSDFLGKDEYPVTSLRFWKWTISQDKTIYRPTNVIVDDALPPDSTIGSVLLSISAQEKCAMAHVLLYVEKMRPTSAKIPVSQVVGPQARGIRVFVKASCAREHTLTYLGPLDLMRNRPLSESLPELAVMLRMPAESVTEQTIRVVLEGTRGQMPRELDITQPVMNLGLALGDIIILQPASFSSIYRNPSVIDLIFEVKSKRTIFIHDVKALADPPREIQVQVYWDYGMVCDTIATALSRGPAPRQVHPDFIQLYRNTQLYTPYPSDTPIRSTINLNVWDMCNVHGYTSNHIFYQVLERSRFDEERTLALKVRLMHPNGAVDKDVQLTMVAPVALQDVVRRAVLAPAVAPPVKAKEGSPGVPPAPATATATATAAASTSPPREDPSSCSSPLYTHYAALHVIELCSRPCRAVVDVSLDQSAAPVYLTHRPCPGEWIFFTPVPDPSLQQQQQNTAGRTRDWKTSSSDDEGDGSNSQQQQQQQQQTQSSDGGVTGVPQRIRVPVTQGEYFSAHQGATFIGNPFFVDIDPLHTTIEQVMHVALHRNGLTATHEDVLPNPFMLVVDDTVPDGDALLSESDVLNHIHGGRHFRFTDLGEKIFPFIRNHEDRYFVYLNRKNPKEKPGSRYVATNDPKLTLEKKKTPT